MLEYKNAEQVREELEKISHELVREYKIEQLEDEVKLMRGSNVIRCGKWTLGGKDGLYEAHLSVNGKGVVDLFKKADNTIGWLDLKGAVEIVETAVAAQNCPDKLPALEKAVCMLLY